MLQLTDHRVDKHLLHGPYRGQILDSNHACGCSSMFAILSFLYCFFLTILQNQFTSLHVTNNVEILKLLIDAGGNVNAVDEVSSCVMSMANNFEKIINACTTHVTFILVRCISFYQLIQ